MLLFFYQSFSQKSYLGIITGGTNSNFTEKNYYISSYITFESKSKKSLHFGLDYNKILNKNKSIHLLIRPMYYSLGVNLIDREHDKIGDYGGSIVNIKNNIQYVNVSSGLKILFFRDRNFYSCFGVFNNFLINSKLIGTAYSPDYETIYFDDEIYNKEFYDFGFFFGLGSSMLIKEDISLFLELNYNREVKPLSSNNNVFMNVSTGIDFNF